MAIGGSEAPTNDGSALLQLTKDWKLYTIKIQTRSLADMNFQFYSNQIVGDNKIDFELANVSLRYKINQN